MRDLAKLRALTGAEWRLLAFCLAALPALSLGIAVFGFRRIHAMLARRPAPAGASVPRAEAEALGRSISRIVAIAASRGPVRAACLRRSLLTWWLLRRRGITGALRIGVSREARPLHAHAWVELFGAPINDDPDIASRFPAFEQDLGVPATETS